MDSWFKWFTNINGEKDDEAGVFKQRRFQAVHILPLKMAVV